MTVVTFYRNYRTSSIFASRGFGGVKWWLSRVPHSTAKMSSCEGKDNTHCARKIKGHVPERQEKK